MLTDKRCPGELGDCPCSTSLDALILQAVERVGHLVDHHLPANACESWESPATGTKIMAGPKAAPIFKVAEAMKNAQKGEIVAVYVERGADGVATVEVRKLAPAQPIRPTARGHRRRRSA